MKLEGQARPCGRAGCTVFVALSKVYRVPCPTPKAGALVTAYREGVRARHSVELAIQYPVGECQPRSAQTPNRTPQAQQQPSHPTAYNPDINPEARKRVAADDINVC